MKFCNKCGAQFADEATFCTKCGNSLNATPVNPNPAPVNPNPAPQGYAAPQGYVPQGYAAPQGYAPYVKPYVDPVKAREKKSALFGFLFNICLALYSFFTALSVVIAYIYTYVYTTISSSGSYYTYYYANSSAYSYLWLDETCSYIGTALSACVLAFGIVSFVFRLKDTDLNKKLSGITHFVVY